MARSRDDEVDRIGREVSVQRLAEARAIVLATGKAGDLVGACPLCDAAEGLAVSPGSNVWACAGCGEGGGPVEWVMVTEGVSRAHAVELLREGLPATSTSPGRKPPKVNSRALLPAPFEPGTTDDDLLEQVVGFYHRTLREAPQPAAYLERRKLADSEMVEVFRLGFANRTLGYRLPAGNRAAGKVLRTQLRELGVWSAKGHEAYDGSVVVPIVDINGRLVQLYGRKIGQHLRKGTRLHTWLATPARPLFNPAALEVGDEVVLAGSVIDALTLWCAGFRHTVGVDGVEGFDDTHLSALADAGVRSVRIAYRRDDPGERAARSTAEALLAAGVECLRGRASTSTTGTRSTPSTGTLTTRAAAWSLKPTATTSVSGGRAARPSHCVLKGRWASGSLHHLSCAGPGRTASSMARCRRRQAWGSGSRSAPEAKGAYQLPTTQSSYAGGACMGPGPSSGSTGRSPAHSQRMAYSIRNSSVPVSDTGPGFPSRHTEEGGTPLATTRRPLVARSWLWTQWGMLASAALFIIGLGLLAGSGAESAVRRVGGFLFASAFLVLAIAWIGFRIALVASRPDDRVVDTLHDANMMMLPFPSAPVKEAFGPGLAEAIRPIRAAWMGCAVLAVMVIIANVIVAVV